MAGVGRALNRLALISAGVGVTGYLLDESLYTVEGGHRAVIWDRFNGVSPSVVGEGTHFRIPLLQYPYVYDVRLRPRVVSSKTGTKDLQTVTISLRVLSRPAVEELPTIYRTLGMEWDERVLPSIVNEVLKATVAQFDAEQLLTQRDKVSRQISEALNERAADFNVVLEDVSITHLAFGREFTKAIETKQVAQQDAERSKFIVAMAEQEKRAAIIRAEGESQAAELISSALKEHGTGMIEVKRIDAAKEVAETLARSRNVTYLPGSGSNLLLNLNGGRK
jgi:prohibitin 1